MSRNEDAESFQEGLMAAWVEGKSFVSKVSWEEENSYQIEKELK